MPKQVILSHKGETRTYYVDGFPADLKKKLGVRWKSEWELAKLNVRFYNHKYTEGDSDVLAQLRSLYDGIRQPNENQVRRAMILLINEDYGLKSGGESASDSIFSSSLAIWIADPQTGEDKRVTLVKKYSTKFEEVLITMEEIEQLFELCLTPKERVGVLENEAHSIAKELCRRELGFESNFSGGVKKVMPKEFAVKLLQNYKAKGVTFPMYNKSIDTAIEFIKPDLTTTIIEDQEGVNKTLKFQTNAQKRIDAYERVRAFIKAEVGEN